MNKRGAYLVWQDPERRLWFPVGRLTRLTDGTYVFYYTKGTRKAKGFGFKGIHGLPEDRASESTELFPLFANRLMQPGRPEYPDYLSRLNLEQDADPLTILARSEGRRQTDTFQVMPEPERDSNGRYQICFFAHGLSHLEAASCRVASSLKARDQLCLMRDIQNPVDSDALLLRTETFVAVGFCPRFLLADFHALIRNDQEHVAVTVERSNPEPAPVQQRLLCRLIAPWPTGFRAFAAEEFQPLSAPAAIR